MMALRRQRIDPTARVYVCVGVCKGPLWDLAHRQGLDGDWVSFLSLISSRALFSTLELYIIDIPLAVS